MVLTLDKPITNTLVVKGGIRGSVLTPGKRGVAPGQPSSGGPGGGGGIGHGKGGSGSGKKGSSIAIEQITFAAPTSTGNQSISLPFRASALIFFTVGIPTASETITASIRESIGFCTSTSEQYCISGALQDNVQENASHVYSNKAITIVEWGQVLRGEASVTSITGSGFVLNWTTAPTTAVLIQCLAIKGALAKAVQWGLTTSAGNQSVNTVGFEPTVVIHAHTGHSFFASTINTRRASGGVGLSVQYPSGSWSRSWCSNDGNFLGEQAYYGNVEAIAQSATIPGADPDYKVSHVSFDVNGFTINKNAGFVPSSNVGIISLCLRGINVAVGTTAKPTGAAPQTLTISGLSFTPKGLILGSLHAPATIGLVNGTGVKSGVGIASSATKESGQGVWSTNAGANPVRAFSILSTSAIYIKSDSSSILVKGDFSGFSSDGFSIVFNPNDAVADFVGYLALG